MTAGWDPARPPHTEEEGGCGVTGFACSIPVRGRHIYEPSVQMHNRGNGKGGGIAAVGLVPEQLGVSREVLSEDYLLQIALLDPACRNAVESDFITPFYDIDSAKMLDHIDDYHDVEGLEVRPPEVMQYFVRVKHEALARFARERRLDGLPDRDIEDEFIYQNTFELNSKYYASLGEKQAFVLSRGRDQLILKIVGYAEQIVTYYKIEDLRAHVWIAHQRYPTRGRLWHPGGAHPFCGLNEALVHNGDFANYHSVTEYLAQRNIVPLFLTDTEVSILVFDLWNRVYKYPLEHIIEGLAPTAERDFDMLPKDKQDIYRQMQRAHIHASPDGPWFFIIAQNDVANDSFRLMGITDTAMLRPQVFALQDGEVQIGLICSEKQAIDATLHSLAKEDSRFCTIADDYWNARGASYTDGGAFVFTLAKNPDGTRSLTCADKFGRERRVESSKLKVESWASSVDQQAASSLLADESGHALFEALKVGSELSTFNFELATDAERTAAINGLTLMIDRRYSTGANKRARILEAAISTLTSVFEAIPCICRGEAFAGEACNAERSDSKCFATTNYARIDWETRDALREPQGSEDVLVVNAHDFPPEGDDCDARLVVRAYELGWRKFKCYGYVGQRFLGCGFGANSHDAVIDAYGSSGDYLASGLDGATVIVHCNAQDQVAQILKRGKLIVHGDVGQTFMYGAKGGTVFIKGNAAGRPLINAVGRPKAIINGTCLDFLAESFMAGDPLTGGGFVILNGVRFDADGNVVELDTPYSGSNLFSLASGGAIYVRDPRKQLDNEQLNGGEYLELSDADWKLIKPYLDENERLFDIPVSSLLTVDGVEMTPKQVYRKVAPIRKMAAAAVAATPDDDVNISEESYG